MSRHSEWTEVVQIWKRRRGGGKEVAQDYGGREKRQHREGDGEERQLPIMCVRKRNTSLNDKKKILGP